MDTFEKAVIAGVALLVSTTISAFAVMFVWDGLMPELFSLPTIRYGQAFSLTILGQLLAGKI